MTMIRTLLRNTALAGMWVLCGCVPIEALAAIGQTAAVSVPGQVPPLPPVLPDGIPAFPGAWGGGMFATGGRGGRVIEVTTLADSGPGSLRAAVGEQGPRIVVFRVAGIVHMESDIDIDSPDITIAGQSAPGDGICLAGHSLNINTRNVVHWIPLWPACVHVDVKGTVVRRKATTGRENGRTGPTAFVRG